MFHNVQSLWFGRPKYINYSNFHLKFNWSTEISLKIRLTSCRWLCPSPQWLGPRSCTTWSERGEGRRWTHTWVWQCRPSPWWCWWGVESVVGCCCCCGWVRSWWGKQHTSPCYLIFLWLYCSPLTSYPHQANPTSLTRPKRQNKEKNKEITLPYLPLLPF